MGESTFDSQLRSYSFSPNSTNCRSGPKLQRQRIEPFAQSPPLQPTVPDSELRPSAVKLFEHFPFTAMHLRHVGEEEVHQAGATRLADLRGSDNRMLSMKSQQKSEIEAKPGGNLEGVASRRLVVLRACSAKVNGCRVAMYVSTWAVKPATLRVYSRRATQSSTSRRTASAGGDISSAIREQ